MIWFKACPRCQIGDVTVEKDVYGWYILCLQCGLTKDVATPALAQAILPQARHSLLVRQTA